MSANILPGTDGSAPATVIPPRAASLDLPALREDLILLPAGDNRDGSPAWMIQDPVANRFYRIGWLEFEMLARWQTSADLLLDQVHAETPLAPDESSLQALLAFLQQNFLVRTDSPAASARLAEISARQRRRDLRWLVHHYLFIRIPLLRPERFLAATLPRIEFVFSRTFAILVLSMTVAGLWLAFRQWDSFISSIHESFTPAGVVAYLTALCVAKLLHELGHAYTATRYGVRVAHMGVSLVVLFPLLYTDTSESWKLTDRRQRLAIVAAGMLTEIAVAGIATLAWSLVDDGPLRSALFFLATTSWVLSLGVNASPFMRFDGYFLLSDMLDLPNLHARSSALARAFLRRHLLGWREAAAESLPPRLAGFLVAFALVTWAYRLMVFLAIALLVYLYFFKLLGTVLFAIEILWFIVLPVWSEIKVWWARRDEIRASRRRLAWGLLALLVLLSAIPLPHGIEAPAWIRAEKTLALYSPYPARILQVHPPGMVVAGDVLLALDSPDNRARGARAEAVTATLWSRLQRSNSSTEDAEQRAMLSGLLRQEMAEASSARDEVDRLVLRAPFSGVLSDLDPLVQAGSWVSPQQQLGILFAPDQWIVEAFVDQRGRQYLKPGDSARVYPTGSLVPIKAQVIGIDSARTLRLPDPMLDAAHGGTILVSTVGGRAEVQRSLYRVRLRLEEPPPSPRTQLASAVIRAAPHMLTAGWLQGLASLLVRESGF